jgi:hypothetical protein
MSPARVEREQGATRGANVLDALRGVRLVELVEAVVETPACKALARCRSMVGSRAGLAELRQGPAVW